ncbi:MAG: LLM class F420-dependent oxidoreductase, partial [Actinomycetota bacterium]|nr:LLM class F420-dependent oxidoreductase [Actinomycetota bacterium]
MRIGMPLGYAQGFRIAVEELPRYEKAGLDAVHVPEAYTFDSVSALGYIAARTTSLTLTSGILNVYSRTPALLAMTAAGLDSMSDGRFVLGLGASGPQVVEGFHGVPYAAPLTRTREVVEICRAVWRREALSYQGSHFTVPLDVQHGGSGLGKPLKLINHPLRERVPVLLAAMGPKNVALAAELCEAWEPIFWYPEGVETAFGAALREGATRRDPALQPLEVVADSHLAVVDDEVELEAALGHVRAHLALYVGGMGARGSNFYNDLVVRFGFAEQAAVVQDLFLAGDREAAAAAVPDELVRGVSLIGTAQEVAARLSAFARSG